MRRPWLVPTLVLLALLCVAASALAQDDEHFTPLLGPDSEGVRLEVRAEPDLVCIQLSDAGGPDSGRCSDFTQPDLYGPFALDLERGDEGRPTSLGGVVRANVTRVEYVTADGRTFAAGTVTAPQLGGRAGSELRFYLLTLPAGADAVTRRLLDASGGLISESDDVGGPGTGRAPRPLRGPVRLARGHGNGVDWNVYATVRNVLEPVRGDVGRRRPRMCLATNRVPFGVGSCEGSPERTFSLDYSSGCPGRRASLILGIAGPGVRVDLRMGDGRWRPARMLTAPAGYAPPGERAWVFAIPADSAVRAIRGRAADGRVVGTESLGLPPPRLSCDNGDLFGVFSSDDESPPALTGPEATVTPPGGPPVRVADAEAQLCVALGPAPDDRNCRLPSPNLADTVIAVSPDGRSIGGAVDPGVASVEARTIAGKHVRVPTDPGTGYRGRYAGLVRFFSVSGPDAIASFTLRDAAGRALIEQPVSFELSRIGRPRVLFRGRAAGGRFDVVQARFDFSDVNRPVGCLAVVRRGKTLRDPFSCLSLVERGKHLSVSLVNGEARCGLRGAFLVGGASRRAASVRGVLDDGSVVAGRLFRSGLGRAFFLSPPAGRGLRRIEVLDKAGKRLQRYAARVPPAREQCGYGFALFAAGARSAAARVVRPAAPARVGQPYAAYRSFRLTGLQWQRR
jgi:hypothetical protein